MEAVDLADLAPSRRKLIEFELYLLVSHRDPLPPSDSTCFDQSSTYIRTTTTTVVIPHRLTAIVDGWPRCIVILAVEACAFFS